MIRRFLVLLVLLALAVTSTATAQAPTTVKVGAIGIMADAGLYIGVERGYFTEKGLRIEMVPIASAGDVMAMLATGQLDFVGGGYTVPLFNAIARGLPIRAVVGRGVEIPGHETNVILVRPDLVDAIKSPRDLKGRKLAVNSPVSALIYPLGKIMESVGLTVKDLDLVNIPFPQMGTALTTRAVDAVIAVEPFVTLLHEKGTGVRWKGTAAFVTDPVMHISTYLTNHEWAEKHPKVAQDFVAGYLRGVRVYHEAMLAGKARDEVVGYLVKHTPVKDRALYERIVWQFADPNGAMGRKSVEDQIAWYFKSGMITRKLPVDQVLDLRYLEAAVKDIGALPCPKCGW